jgi:hypothetical protein
MARSTHSVSLQVTLADRDGGMFHQLPAHVGADAGLT